MDKKTKILQMEKLRQVYFKEFPSHDEWTATFGVLGERCSLLLREIETLQDAGNKVVNSMGESSGEWNLGMNRIRNLLSEQMAWLLGNLADCYCLGEFTNEVIDDILKKGANNENATTLH